MSYDSCYKKTHDRQAAIILLKRNDIILLILFAVLFPAGVYLVHFLISLIFITSINYFSVIFISVASVVLVIFDYSKKVKSNYRYVHCTHDIKAVLKQFEAERENEKKPSFDNAYGGMFNEGKVFRYTLSNDARVSCDFDNGIYTFKVYNDEWDEVGNFTAEREEDFEEVMLKSLGSAASLEKQPDGEYDESLEPEVELDEYEDGDFEEDEDGETEENKED